MRSTSPDDPPRYLNTERVVCVLVVRRVPVEIAGGYDLLAPVVCIEDLVA